MATKRYSGRLVSPITRAQSPTFEGAFTQDRVADFHRALVQHDLTADNDQRRQEAEKIALLMEHYQIAKNDMRALVLALARRHVPGFEVVPQKGRGGRPRKWDGPELVELVQAVEEAKQSKSCSDRNALKLITSKKAKTKRWCLPANHQGRREQWIETLESRLNEARKHVAYIDSLPKMLSDLQKKFRKR
jgi:hypothetical protein